MHCYVLVLCYVIFQISDLDSQSVVYNGKQTPCQNGLSVTIPAYKDRLRVRFYVLKRILEAADLIVSWKSMHTYFNI